eukprot:GEMP01093506.1.p1 GENE.GEMP01093506.1~~GEMP01093506.1.p1  ORF type:complete len:200 (+),score=40.80 GEMP01093506.1:58-657(+)
MLVFLLVFASGRLLGIKCSCERSCQGVVVPPRQTTGDESRQATTDVLSLIQCVSVTEDCDNAFCSQCRAAVPTRPRQRFVCVAQGARVISLLQVQVTSQIRAQCAPPQPCQCHCTCPEIVWPVPPPMALLPTPAPYFAFLQKQPVPGIALPAPGAAVNMMPPPPMPPLPPPPPDWREQPCPETTPCNCYCHCEDPSQQA